MTSQTFYWRKDRCYRIDIKSSRKDESIGQSGLKELQQFQTYHWIELMKLRLMDWSTISFFTAIGYKVCELPLLNVRLVISFTCSGNIWKVDSVGFDRWFIQVFWNRDSSINDSRTVTNVMHFFIDNSFTKWRNFDNTSHVKATRKIKTRSTRIDWKLSECNASAGWINIIRTLGMYWCFLLSPHSFPEQVEKKSCEKFKWFYKRYRYRRNTFSVSKCLLHCGNPGKFRST